MKRSFDLKHKFVDSLPDALGEGTLYVCMDFATAAHKCCCGCELEVITPLSPTDWKLLYDGRTVTLHPSIGNWSFPCQSHYWIRSNRVEWAPSWSDAEIRAGRLRDRQKKELVFEMLSPLKDQRSGEPALETVPGELHVWQKVVRWGKG